MAEPEKLILSDPLVFPDDNYIHSIIGDKKLFWNGLTGYLSENFKESAGEWRYYNDGKQWLYKFVYKKKTVFWSGLLRDGFRVTFYFGNKAEPVILASDLPDHVKADFIDARQYGKIRPITMMLNSNNDMELAKNIALIKIKLK